MGRVPADLQRRARSLALACGLSVLPIVDSAGGWEPIHVAAAAGDVEVLSQLLDGGTASDADVGAVFIEGCESLESGEST